MIMTSLAKTRRIILAAADHFRNSKRGSGAGTEWFLTHLKFLDSTAELLGLKIHRLRDRAPCA